MHIDIYAYTCMCVYVWVCVNMYTGDTHARTHTHIYIYMCVCLCVCLQVYIYIYWCLSASKTKNLIRKQLDPEILVNFLMFVIFCIWRFEISLYFLCILCFFVFNSLFFNGNFGLPLISQNTVSIFSTLTYTCSEQTINCSCFVTANNM